LTEEVSRSDLPRPALKRVTSAEVARAVGVSRATVSYVLNNTPSRRVSAATRRMVLAEAARLGHVPSAAARSLRLGSSNVVLALIVDHVGTGYTGHRTLQVLDDALAKRGYMLVVHRFAPDLRPLSEIWKLMSPALVVSMGGLSLLDRESIRDARAKLVGVWSLIRHRDAGVLQVEYLVKEGHSKIGYALPTLPYLQGVAAERLEGARSGCAALNLEAPVVRVVSPDDPGSFTTALQEWRRLGITAVCAHSDEIAAMLFLAAASAGVEIPGELAVIGADDAPIARMGITTIKMDLERYSAAIVEMALRALDDKPLLPAPEQLFSVVRRRTA